jgi:biopolymer transport protein ExbD
MLTPRQKRAARRGRNDNLVDMNLVSLIDVFTILIFFLLSNATGVELLPSPKTVQLPSSSAEKLPRETVVVIVSSTEVTVQGQRVAGVADVLAGQGTLIEPLKAELQRLAKTPGSQALTLMGDKDIPYQLLRKVMVSATQAGFNDIAFAVRHKD